MHEAAIYPCRETAVPSVDYHRPGTRCLSLADRVVLRSIVDHNDGRDSTARQNRSNRAADSPLAVVRHDNDIKAQQSISPQDSLTTPSKLFRYCVTATATLMRPE